MVLLVDQIQLGAQGLLQCRHAGCDNVGSYSEGGGGAGSGGGTGSGKGGAGSGKDGRSMGSCGSKPNSLLGQTRSKAQLLVPSSSMVSWIKRLCRLYVCHP